MIRTSQQNKKKSSKTTFAKLLDTITKYPNGMQFYIDRTDTTMIRYARGFVNIFAIKFVRKNKKHNIYTIAHNNLSSNIPISYIMKRSRNDATGALDYYIFNE